MKTPDKKAARKSFWSALSRIISVVLGAGSGSILYHTLGVSGTTMALSMAVSMAVIGFFLMWIVEYEREIE